MGVLYRQYIEGQNIYSCVKCGTELTSYKSLVSKAFRGLTGTAFLFDTVINIEWGRAEETVLVTGIHTVCDIFCRVCTTKLGWKYIKAEEHQEKYKEGKFILEKFYLRKTQWVL